MTGDIATILALGLAAAVDPVAFTLTLMLLSKPDRPRERVIAFLVGALSVGTAVVLLGFALGQATAERAVPGNLSLWIDLVLGAFFIIFGIRTWLVPEPQIKIQGKNRQHLLRRLFVVGIIAAIVSFDDLVLIFAASREVGILPAGLAGKITLLIITLIFFSAPITVPLLASLLFPKTSRRLLDKINYFLEKYGQEIVAVLFILMGVIFIWEGLKIFI